MGYRSRNWDKPTMKERGLAPALAGPVGVPFALWNVLRPEHEDEKFHRAKRMAETGVNVNPLDFGLDPAKYGDVIEPEFMNRLKLQTEYERNLPPTDEQKLGYVDEFYRMYPQGDIAAVLGPEYAQFGRPDPTAPTREEVRRQGWRNLFGNVPSDQPIDEGYEAFQRVQAEGGNPLDYATYNPEAYKMFERESIEASPTATQQWNRGLVQDEVTNQELVNARLLADSRRLEIEQAKRKLAKTYGDDEVRRLDALVDDLLRSSQYRMAQATTNFDTGLGKQITPEDLRMMWEDVLDPARDRLERIAVGMGMSPQDYRLLEMMFNARALTLYEMNPGKEGVLEAEDAAHIDTGRDVDSYRPGGSTTGYVGKKSTTPPLDEWKRWQRGPG